MKNYALILCLSLTGCLTKKNTPYDLAGGDNVKVDTLTWFDSARSRRIPVALYSSNATTHNSLQRVVIFSHGYGRNRGGNYLSYSYLTNKLASEGFFVVSIQHELPTDRLLPLAGIPQVVRRPFWERGADNILFVINRLKKLHPHLDYGHLALIGHSNGGDMTALFPQKYPGIARKIVTLDNRRMALPRTETPGVYSLRSSDQSADEGVLPTEEEKEKFGMTIIKLAATPHNVMDDTANPAQRREINDFLLTFLKE